VTLPVGLRLARAVGIFPAPNLLFPD